MSANTLPAPGTPHGPCTDACAHPSCEATRRMSNTCCTTCTRPIGFGAPFYDGDTLEHAACADLRVEAETFDFARLTKLGVRTMRASPAYDLTLALDRKPILLVKNDGNGGCNDYHPHRNADPKIAGRVRRMLEIAVRHATGHAFEPLDHLCDCLADGARDGYHAMLTATMPPRDTPDDVRVGDRILFGPLRGSGEVLRGQIIGQERRRWIVRQSIDGSGYRAGTPWTLGRDDLWLDHKPLSKWAIHPGDPVIGRTGADASVISGNAVTVEGENVTLRTHSGSLVATPSAETWRVEDPSTPRWINTWALDMTKHAPNACEPSPTAPPKKASLADLMAAARAAKGASS